MFKAGCIIKKVDKKLNELIEIIEYIEYIEFYYNRFRSQSYLGNLSPVKFEEKQKILKNEMVA